MDANKLSLAEFTMKVTFDAQAKAAFEANPLAYIDAHLGEYVDLAKQVVDPKVSEAVRTEASRQVGEILAKGHWAFGGISSWTITGVPMKVDVDPKNGGNKAKS